eukprot:2244776-Prymnesium_polylepis.1
MTDTRPRGPSAEAACPSIPGCTQPFLPLPLRAGSDGAWRLGHRDADPRAGGTRLRGGSGRGLSERVVAPDGALER